MATNILTSVSQKLGSSGVLREHQNAERSVLFAILGTRGRKTTYIARTTMDQPHTKAARTQFPHVPPKCPHAKKTSMNLKQSLAWQLRRLSNPTLNKVLVELIPFVNVEVANVFLL